MAEAKNLKAHIFFVTFSILFIWVNVTPKTSPKKIMDPQKTPRVFAIESSCHFLDVFFSKLFWINFNLDHSKMWELRVLPYGWWKNTSPTPMVGDFELETLLLVLEKVNGFHGFWRFLDYPGLVNLETKKGSCH